MHFGHQRTGGVEHAQAARFGIAAHGLRHAMRAENQRCAGRHLVEVFDKHRAFFAQIIDHKFIVNDFMPHINRRAMQCDGALNDFDGAINTGTETTGIGEENLHDVIIGGDFPCRSPMKKYRLKTNTYKTYHRAGGTQCIPPFVRRANGGTASALPVLLRSLWFYAVPDQQPRTAGNR